jgi:acetoin:2,6-dichlorophenolindophenol oxidoreductase subunit beta
MYTQIEPETRLMSYSEAINGALTSAMESDPTVICFGLGVDDPKGVFGTTKGLHYRFGPQRVFDMPTSENAMTGVAIGAAINGLRPVMCHQRLDFFLLAMDQLVNHAAKWHYMFGGQRPIPITIRMLLGRGWGQGPTHAQSLQAWFAHIPGLKVVMPATPLDAHELLLASIFDNNPVVFLEHRWLYDQAENQAAWNENVPIGKARRIHCGKDVTLVSYSFMAIEALRAARTLEPLGVSCDVTDLRTIKPLDIEPIVASIRKTGRLLVIDNSPPFCSVGSEIVSRAVAVCFNDLRLAPVKMAFPDTPAPTSFALTQNYYPKASDIAQRAADMLGVKVPTDALRTIDHVPHDIPGDWFKGPF